MKKHEKTDTRKKSHLNTDSQFYLPQKVVTVSYTAINKYSKEIFRSHTKLF